MTNLTCPLCKANTIIKLDSLNPADINNLYKQLYNIDVLYLFKESQLFFYRCENCGLKFFTPSVIGDERFYSALQKLDLYYMEEKEEYEFASQYISKTDDVLDVGCGKGAFSKKITCKSFTGLELSENAKELADQYGVKIINQTIQEHSLHNKEKYDVACAFQVLEHVELDILSDFLDTMIGSVKQDGLIIISVPSDDSFVSVAKNSALNMPPHHQTRWPDKTLKHIAALFNLDIVNLHHDTLAARNRDECIHLSMASIFTNNHSVINKKQSIPEKVSYHLVRLLPGKIKDAIVDTVKPNGHSITAVYRKKV